jgi:predicted DNA-binding ribbon-helix-helix protein
MTDTPEMNDPKARALELDGAKTFIRLDAATWKAIDMLATHSLCDWSEWVRRAWEQAKEAAGSNKAASINKAAALRFFAMLGLIRLNRAMVAMQHAYMPSFSAGERISIELAPSVSMTFTRAEALGVIEKISYALALTDKGAKASEADNDLGLQGATS